MKVSCIIPTYNSARNLELGLKALSLQQLTDGVELEVIVVDDGSTDNTVDTVESFRTVIQNLSYVFRPRDALANRSRTRNLGLAQSQGDLICFLDSGVIVPANFIALTVSRFAEEPHLVLAHETFGLNIDPETEDTRVVAGFTVDRLDDYVQQIRKMESWQDLRAMSAQFIQKKLSLLPAPWTEGWSCALSVPAALIEKAGGFDEKFYGWGVEDVEFSYRLYHAGAVFSFETKAYAFHYPHPISRSAEKEHSLRRNLRQMHHKHYQLDTECYLPYLGLHYQAFLEKLNVLELSDIVPSIPSAPAISSHGKEVLAIGFDRVSDIRALGASHAFAHNRKVHKELSEQLPDVDVDYLLGVDLPYEDHYFEVVYLSDFVRVLHPFMAQLLFKEVRRAAKRAVWIHKESDQSPFPDIRPEVHERLNDLSRMPAGNTAALFYQEISPSMRKRFVMEKLYWTSKDELLTLAALEELTLDCISCREMTNQT